VQREGKEIELRIGGKKKYYQMRPNTLTRQEGRRIRSSYRKREKVSWVGNTWQGVGLNSMKKTQVGAVGNRQLGERELLGVNALGSKGEEKSLIVFPEVRKKGSLVTAEKERARGQKKTKNRVLQQNPRKRDKQVFPESQILSPTNGMKENNRGEAKKRTWWQHSASGGERSLAGNAKEGDQRNVSVFSGGRKKEERISCP